MTKRIGRAVITEPERPQQCDMCGKIAELRPYGPDGKCICFECGQIDPVGSVQRYMKIMFDEDISRVDAEKAVGEIFTKDE